MTLDEQPNPWASSIEDLAKKGPDDFYAVCRAFAAGGPESILDLWRRFQDIQDAAFAAIDPEIAERLNLSSRGHKAIAFLTACAKDWQQTLTENRP